MLEDETCHYKTQLRSKKKMLPCYACNAGGALGGICEKKENPVRILREVLLESATFKQKSPHILSVMCVCIFLWLL